MNWRRWLAALLVMLAVAGSVYSAGGSGQAPTAPYQEQDLRDTSGMH